MAKWTPDEDARLKGCAEAGLSAKQAALAVSRLGTPRTESSVAGRATKLGVPFNSARNIGLRDFLTAGGCLVRDEIGGVVGVRWTPAARCGGEFSTDACEHMLGLGLLSQEPGSHAVYRAAH